MIVAYSRPIAIKIYRKLLEIRPDWTEKVGVVMTGSNSDPEDWKEIVGTKSISVGSDDNKRFWANKNKILNNYHGGNGIKTGFTKDAGRCLIASATRNDVTVVSVVLNRYNMFRECELLMDKAFAKLL